MEYKMDVSLRTMLRGIFVDLEIVASYEDYDAMTDEQIYDASEEYLGMK